MRTYYIFNINNYFTYMYKNKPYRIYKILEEMYNVKKSDIVLSYKLFEQIAYSFNKNKLNEYVKYLFKNNTSYYNRLNSHIICNNQEYTKLTINNSNIKIKSNINYPSFLDISSMASMGRMACWMMSSLTCISGHSYFRQLYSFSMLFIRM